MIEKLSSETPQNQEVIEESMLQKNNPNCTAQALVNKEVRKQLPNTVSDNTLRKKKERDLKIFELFNAIGEDKI
ncbi:19468_t:CDS:2 [Funneliformis geosporum]|nr:19468_t:CDS:2 [Funneliformis geosporum]